MAVPSFTNITLVDPLDAGFMSPITAFGATGSVPSTTSTSTRGIDEDVKCCRLQNGGVSLTAGDIVGAHGTLPAAYDISGASQALYMHMHNRAGFSRLSGDDDTVRIILTSGGGTTEYAAWEMGGQGSAGYPTATAKWKIISLARAPDEQTAGFDPTNVTGLGATLKIGSTGTTSFELYLDQLLYIDGAVILQGGEVANPASYEEYYGLMGPTSGNAAHSMLLEKSGFAYTTHASLDNQCDYWRETLFTDGLYSLAFAEADGAEKAYPATGFFSNKITCPASADIELKNGLVASGLRVAIDWDLTAATNAKLNSTINASLSSGSIDGGNLEGQTLIGNTSPIEIGTAPSGSWSVKNSSAGGIRITGAAGDYSGLEINFDSITGNAIALGDGGVGTYNLGGISATSSINIHNNSATNAIIVEIPGDVTATSSTAGGTITLQQPQEAYTITSDQPNTLLQIFESGTQTVLASTTGTSLQYIGSGTVDSVAQKAGYIPQRRSGVALSGGSQSDGFTMVADPVYFSGHGLTYTTDFSYNRSTSRLTVSTQANGDAIYSALIDAFIAQTSLRNTDFKLQANGPTAFIFKGDAEFFDSASLNNWKRAGVQYLNSGGVRTAGYSAIYTLSSGIPAGAQAEYQQAAGGTVADAINTGAIDELIQIYGDATHGNFTLDTHLVVKYQENGYQQVRVDVVDLYQLTTLQDVAYPIATPFSQLNAATGDPAVNITIVDHTAAPITVGGKSFSYEVQDGGANSGESILREINYNNSLDATYQGKNPFNWPDMVGELGSAYDSVRGWVEDESAQLGFYVSRGGSDHPDFLRFQSNDGTYYTPAVQATAQISNLVAGSRIRIYNRNTATETVNQIEPSAGYSQSYTDGTTYSDGDVIDIYVTYVSGVTAKLEYSAVAVASSSGWSVIANQEDDAVYNLNAIDGSLTTKFSADYIEDEIDVNSVSNFTATEFYAWWCYNMTTEDGIREFFGGYTAIDAANYRNNNTVVSVYWDNLTTTNIRQTDNPRIFRDDGTYPVKNNGTTTGGGGIDINWQDKVFLATTGSGPLTPAQEAQLANAASDSATAVSQNAAIQGSGFDANTDSLVQIRDNLGGGGGGDATEANQLTIISNQAALDAKLDTKADQADVTAVKAKTDQLTFTKSGEVDANNKSVNSTTVRGSGTEQDPWGP